MKFISIPIRNLRRRSLRTTFTIIGISIAVSSVILLISMSRGIEKAWTNSLAERNVHILGMGVETMDILTSTLDEKLENDIKNVPGVKNVSGELVNLTRLKNGSHVIQRGWPKNSFLWKTVHLKEGRIPNPKDSDKILIGQTICDRMNIKTGDTLKMLNKAFVVSGITVPLGTMNNSAVILQLEALQKLITKKGKVTEFHLQLFKPDDIEEVKRIQSELNKKYLKYSSYKLKRLPKKMIFLSSLKI